MEEDSQIEKLKSTSTQTKSNLTLQKAVDLGEYDPKFLSGFVEWHSLSRHVQFEFIRQGLDNRRKHLLTQWADLNNVLYFSKKPHIKEALKNIESQLSQLEEDREKLYLEYSK